VKKAFEESGKNKISSFIPPEWIDEDTWENFISSSIDFINSLSAEEAKKYTEEKCVYCQQPFQTKEAKALIKSYQELHDEHKEKLDEKAKELEEMSGTMDACINAINGISGKNEKIEQEFESISEKNQITFDFNNLKNIFQKYKTAIVKAEKAIIEGADLELIENFWNIYKPLHAKFKAKINKLNKDITDKGSKIKKLEARVEPLVEKKSLYENKNNILKFLKLRGLKKNLSDKISDITPLRQATSSLKTSFANDAPLKEFKKCLKSEYDSFNFSPPEMWNIAPATRSDVNKRVYSIGDKRLAEIFSEGEKKLHALSDFFAQCELDKYKGVYVFDDPVNSLDEDNIEAVADRIIRLAEDGNQVIVFTHNLYFLNSIIDTQKEKVTKVERNHDQINLFKEIRIGETKELKDRLNKIDSRMSEFAEKKPEEINVYDIRSVYDLMSGYLEGFIEKVYFKNVISRYRPNIRMNSLVDLKDLDTTIIDNVLKLYEITSRKGNRHDQPGETRRPKYEELINDVKKMKDDFKI
jgi:wobble nucleotide-excising tRNase